MFAALGIAAVFTFQISSFETDFDNVLGTAGLTTETARFDTSILDLFVSDTAATPLFKAFHRNPWRIPFLAEALRYDMAGNLEKPNELLRIGMRTLGIHTRRSLIANPNAKAEADAGLADGLEKTLNAYRESGLIKGEMPSIATVPPDVQKAAALILQVLSKAVSYRRLALRPLGNIDESFAFVASTANADPDGEALDRVLRTPRSVDLAYMAASAHDVLLASATARGYLEKVPPAAKYNFEISTTWGMIRLSGGSADTVADKPSLLVIDTGGDDVYINHPRTASASNWASVLIDTDGKDSYLSSPDLKTQDIGTFAARKQATGLPGPGGALFGVTCLLDSKGNDLYRSHLPAIGSGRFGFGFVLDFEGDDTYNGYISAQGYGHQGGGVLVDLAGSDQYRCFQSGQGGSGTNGFGFLIDRSGNDLYAGEDSVIDFPSPQDAKHNVSFCQGASTGRRADYSDGHSLPGGVGLLLDHEGDDSYTCGVFGQGVGYWQGVGMLIDGNGKDNYMGQWYVQGASAHFAVGYLQDDAGNDSYTALLNMAQGAGHDFSIGMLVDKSGNDTYKAPNLSLGSGNANGIGILIEVLGDDRYESSGLTLGKAAPAPKYELRSRALTLGVFMDLFGTDIYPESAVHAGNARRSANWTERNTRASDSQVGVYFDR